MPHLCRPVTEPDAALGDRPRAFAVAETHSDDSHLARDLLRCCGALHLRERREEIDTQDGDDPVPVTFDPVRGKGDRARAQPTGPVRPIPRLHHRRPSGGPPRRARIGAPRTPLRRAGAA